MPQLQDMPLCCASCQHDASCQHEWTGQIVIQCSIKLAAASMRELVDRGCPACGARAEGTVCLALTQSSGAAHV